MIFTLAGKRETKGGRCEQDNRDCNESCNRAICIDMWILRGLDSPRGKSKETIKDPERALYEEVKRIERI